MLSPATRSARLGLHRRAGLLRLALASVVAIVLLHGSVPATATGPPAGLVAAYSFDDGSGTTLTDSSGGGHNGTIVGGSWTGGHDSGALSFDGNGAYVDL